MRIYDHQHLTNIENKYRKLWFLDVIIFPSRQNQSLPTQRGWHMLGAAPEMGLVAIPKRNHAKALGNHSTNNPEYQLYVMLYCLSLSIYMICIYIYTSYISYQLYQLYISYIGSPIPVKSPRSRTSKLAVPIRARRRGGTVFSVS